MRTCRVLLGLTPHSRWRFGSTLEEAVRLVACWGGSATVSPCPDRRGKATKCRTVLACRNGGFTQLCDDAAENSIHSLIARHGSRSCDRGPFSRHTPRGMLGRSINLELNIATGGDLANRSHTGIVRLPKPLSATPAWGATLEVGGSALRRLRPDGPVGSSGNDIEGGTVACTQEYAQSVAIFSTKDHGFVTVSTGR